MRKGAWIFVGVAALALHGLARFELLDPFGAAAVTLASSVAMALVAHGGTALGAEAIALGAGGALGYEAVRPYFPLVAMGILLAFVFATRAMRSRGWRELGFHLASAFAGGVAASWVAHTMRGHDTIIWSSALLVGALLSSIPWILPADAPRTFALRRLAARTRGTLRWRLLRAVVAHRRLAELELPRNLRRRVDASLDSLCARVERRLDRRVVDRPGPEIIATIDQLVRIARAATSRDVGLERLEASASPLGTDTDALEAEVAALAEF